jgi:hypothetical protein
MHSDAAPLQDPENGRYVRRVRWIGLPECHAWIGKAAHAAIAPKIVIERTVFLNQDHHMFDVS